MGAPRVSVLLPVRNGLPFLPDAMASILSQTCRDFELLVVNDGSSDGSDEAVRATGDPRVRLLAAPGRGLARALNIGLAEARGQYVARHDADDLSHPERLERQLAFLDAHGDVDVLASRVAFIDADGAPVRSAWTEAVQDQWDRALTPDAIARLMPRTCCVVHGSVMARRDALGAVGGYSEQLGVAQDYDLWLRMLPRHRFARLPEPLYTFRIHSDQVSTQAAAEQRRQSIAAKLRYLRRTASLPGVARVWLVDEGSGADLYRDLLAPGFVEVGEYGGWDVAVFTDFASLDARIGVVQARECQANTFRIGNFLVRVAPVRVSLQEDFLVS